MPEPNLAVVDPSLELNYTTLIIQKTLLIIIQKMLLIILIQKMLTLKTLRLKMLI